MKDPCPYCGVIDYMNKCGFCELKKENELLKRIIFKSKTDGCTFREDEYKKVQEIKNKIK